MVDCALTFPRFKVTRLGADSGVLTNLTQTENELLRRAGFRMVNVVRNIHCQGVDHYVRAFNALVTNIRLELKFLLLTETFSDI